DLEMFSRGGLAVLEAIEAQGYDTLNRRPAIGKVKQAGLLGRVLLGQIFSRKPGPAIPRRAGTRPLPPGDAGHAQVGSSDTASLADLAHSYAACWNLAREAHSNFYYAFFLLP